VRFKLSPNPLVVWSLVVTLETAEKKAKLKHTVKRVTLINITFISKSYDWMLNHGGILNRQQSDCKCQTDM